MQVKEAMIKNFKIIQPDTTLREAAQYMRDLDCGYLPIGQNDKLRGAVTDRDIIIRGIAAGHNPDDATVDNIMTEKIVYCFEDEDVEDAARQMKEKQIRRLVVLDNDKQMVGVISLGDIARMTEDSELTGDIEKNIAQPNQRGLNG